MQTRNRNFMVTILAEVPPRALEIRAELTSVIFGLLVAGKVANGPDGTMEFSGRAYGAMTPEELDTLFQGTVREIAGTDALCEFRPA